MGAGGGGLFSLERGNGAVWNGEEVGQKRYDGDHCVVHLSSEFLKYESLYGMLRDDEWIPALASLFRTAWSSTSDRPGSGWWPVVVLVIDEEVLKGPDGFAWNDEEFWMTMSYVVVSPPQNSQDQPMQHI